MLMQWCLESKQAVESILSTLAEPLGMLNTLFLGRDADEGKKYIIIIRRPKGF
jgi:hypothetical protein